MIDFIDKTSEQNGTPINRANLMAIQGFENNNIVFNSDGSITETNNNGEVLTMQPLNIEGIFTQTLVGKKKVVKNVYFSPQGIQGVIS